MIDLVAELLVMVDYGLNKIKLAFDAQYKIVVLTLLTYLV